jgi:TPR repeat protein
MYEHNKGVPTDYNMAMQCYLNAHNNGDAKATNSIGRLYYYGKGVDENEHTALKWFLEAANNGDSTARCNAGFYYEYGRGGVQMDKKYALELYERSAEQGYKGAKTSIRSLNKEGYCIDVLQRSK